MAKSLEALPQGNGSVVTAVYVDGRACVQKCYTSHGDTGERFRRETGFYNYYSGLDCVPALVESHFPDVITVARIEGEPLSSWWAGKRLSHLKGVSRSHGGNVGRFLMHQAAEQKRRLAFEDFPQPASFNELAAKTLERVENLFRTESRFDRAALHEAVACAREIFQTADCWAYECLCKLDWKAADAIVSDDGIAGYVDFEQAFPGTRQVFIGTIVDHIDVIDWDEVKAGIADRCGSFPNLKQQIAGAFFSTCYKVYVAYNEGRISTLSPGRLVQKFEQMARMLRRAG